MTVFFPTIWLAADYHLPVTYSCRIPMSSTTHALTLPTPGPAAVRLALLRCSLELFGHDATREEIFPILRAMTVRICPPEAVAISWQRLRVFKWIKDTQTKQPRIQESLMLREMAHAQGVLTIALQIPLAEEARFRDLCQTIGYWGHTDSFACCLAVHRREPLEQECVLPLHQLELEGRVQSYFSGLATEFRHQELSWEDVTTETIGRGHRSEQQALVLDLYVWPLVLLRVYDGGKLFGRRSLREALRVDR